MNTSSIAPFPRSLACLAVALESRLANRDKFWEITVLSEEIWHPLKVHTKGWFVAAGSHDFCFSVSEESLVKMTDTSKADPPPQTNGIDNDADDDERGKMRPADIDAVSSHPLSSDVDRNF